MSVKRGSTVIRNVHETGIANEGIREGPPGHYSPMNQIWLDSYPGLLDCVTFQASFPVLALQVTRTVGVLKSLEALCISLDHPTLLSMHKLSENFVGQEHCMHASIVS